MKTALVIRVDLSDESDLDWIRHRAIPAVENVVDEAMEEERLDGVAEVSWDVEEVES